jgi:hypothetical protein
MTLGGLLKHLALVEDDMFAQKLLGEKPAPPWDAVDWDADPDWEWHTAADDTPEQLMTLWQEGVTRSRTNLRTALTEGNLDHPAAYTNSRGESPQHPPPTDRHDRGVRTPRRPRGPDPRVSRRPGRRRPTPRHLTHTNDNAR